jgi:hypothetical protein
MARIAYASLAFGLASIAAVAVLLGSKYSHWIGQPYTTLAWVTFDVEQTFEFARSVTQSLNVDIFYLSVSTAITQALNNATSAMLSLVNHTLADDGLQFFNGLGLLATQVRTVFCKSIEPGLVVTADTLDRWSGSSALVAYLLDVFAKPTWIELLVTLAAALATILYLPTGRMLFIAILLAFCVYWASESGLCNTL